MGHTVVPVVQDCVVQEREGRETLNNHSCTSVSSFNTDMRCLYASSAGHYDQLKTVVPADQAGVAPTGPVTFKWV
jgi:hypothetical protein